jgi:SAM-dependent methyltransferase
LEKLVPHEKFDVSQLDRLNDESRFDYLDPELLWRTADVPDAKTIVEIGAGTGMFARRFAEYAPEADVFAIDVSPVMVRWMLEHVPTSQCDRLHPLLARETSIPLGTGEADLVVMINVHHELADPLSSYREALRLLRIGGRLLVADWRPGDMTHGPPETCRVAADQIAEVLSAVGFDEISQHDGLPHHSLMTACKPAVCGL